MELTARFHERCANLPPSGGLGCHQALLGAANAGVRAKLTPQEIFDGIRDSVDDRVRPVNDAEIWDTIKTAQSDSGIVPREIAATFRLPPAVHGAALRDLLASRSHDTTGQELANLSRTYFHPDPVWQFRCFLNLLYPRTDHLFIGHEYAAFDAQPQYIHTVERWLSLPHVPYFRFIVNPLSGQLSATHNGTPSYRSDLAVSAFRYILLEMDGEPVERQVRIWTTIVREGLLDVAAIYHSGGKSLHALVRVQNCTTLEEWRRVVHQDFYPRFAVPLGFDGACKNPARFSRTPGAQEEGRGVQFLYYLGENVGKW